MATAKKTSSKKNFNWLMPWKNFYLSVSVAVNIAFIVLFVTMAGTHALDGMWMREGLNRYCDAANDTKFKDNSEATKALRDFTCAKGDAADDFQKAFNAYLETR